MLCTCMCEEGHALETRVGCCKNHFVTYMTQHRHPGRQHWHRLLDLLRAPLQRATCYRPGQREGLQRPSRKIFADGGGDPAGPVAATRFPSEPILLPRNATSSSAKCEISVPRRVRAIHDSGTALTPIRAPMHAPTNDARDAQQPPACMQLRTAST